MEKDVELIYIDSVYTNVYLPLWTLTREAITILRCTNCTIAVDTRQIALPFGMRYDRATGIMRHRQIGIGDLRGTSCDDRALINTWCIAVCVMI